MKGVSPSRFPPVWLVSEIKENGFFPENMDNFIIIIKNMVVY